MLKAHPCSDLPGNQQLRQAASVTLMLTLTTNLKPRPCSSSSRKSLPTDDPMSLKSQRISMQSSRIGSAEDSPRDYVSIRPAVSVTPALPIAPRKHLSVRPCLFQDSTRRLVEALWPTRLQTPGQRFAHLAWLTFPLQDACHVVV